MVEKICIVDPKFAKFAMIKAMHQQCQLYAFEQMMVEKDLKKFFNRKKSAKRHFIQSHPKVFKKRG